MGALKLIEEARSAGLKLRVEGDRLIVRGPKSAPSLALALLDRKSDVLPLLQEPPAATRPTLVPPPFHADGKEYETEAVRWLRSHLVPGPQRVGDLTRLWCEPVRGYASRIIGNRSDLLNKARTVLGVVTFMGKDGKFWWQLPGVADDFDWSTGRGKRTQ
jgi:hypothetical protein